MINYVILILINKICSKYFGHKLFSSLNELKVPLWWQNVVEVK